MRAVLVFLRAGLSQGLILAGGLKVLEEGIPWMYLGLGWAEITLGLMLYVRPLSLPALYY